MATTLTYSLADFQPFTTIVSADMNTKLNDIKSRLNWAGGTDALTGLGDDNIQSVAVSGGGLTRATKLKAGSAGHVIINDGTGAMSSEATLALSRGGLAFAPSLSGNAGNAVVVNDLETGFSLSSPSQATLTQSFSGMISSLTAGEGITANDAVCLALAKDASNNDIYKVFRCDDDLPDRRVNYLGFATATATVVAHTLTWTDSAALVASNVISYSINGRAYSTTFGTSNDVTLAAIATQIATDPDVQAAAAVDAGSNDRVINITGKGGLQINITGATVTLGASQATVTIATVQAPSGQNVRIRNFGILDAFTGLTTGARYYLSGTTGAITTLPPTANPIFVGQALSSTQLFVNTNALSYQFSTPSVFVRSHGSSTNGDAAVTQDSEHFNFTSWITGISASAGSIWKGVTGGASQYNGNHVQLDGRRSDGALIAQFQYYNKAAWSTQTNRGTPLRHGVTGQLGTILFACKGKNSGGSAVATVDMWNGSAWSSGSSMAQNSDEAGGFVQGSLVHAAAGSGGSNHDAVNISGVTSALTAAPTAAYTGASSSVGTNGYYASGSTTATYLWNGSAWGSSVVMPYITNASSELHAASAYSSTVQLAAVNGGNTTGTTIVNSTVTYNGTSWNSSTSSTNGRVSGYGSVV